MCYAIAYLTRRLEKYAERYNVTLQPLAMPETVINNDLPQYFFVSGFEHPVLPVVTSGGITFSRWGLIPSWAKDGDSASDLKSKTLNAAGETIFEKPSFRKAAISQRCLLGINGFFEWRQFNKQKYPYFITSPNSEILSLGCLFDTWQNSATGEKHHTFSIVTTPANPLMEKIHNTKKRMPLIIPEEFEKDWISAGLTTSQVSELIKPYNENGLKAYTISQKVNQVKNNRNIPEIINPVNYPELTFFGSDIF